MLRLVLAATGVALLTAATPASVVAQGTTAASHPASPAVTAHAGGAATATPGSLPADSAERLLERMRSQLRRLAVAQEAHYMDRGTYTTDLADLGMLSTREERRAGIVLAVMFAGGRGWTAMATTRSLPGMSCVMFVGPEGELPRVPTTAADARTPTREGSPHCDDLR